jgi:hypothetical protein
VNFEIPSVVRRLRTGGRLPAWLPDVARGKEFRCAVAGLVDGVLPGLAEAWPGEPQVVVANGTAAICNLALDPFRTLCKSRPGTTDCGLAYSLLRVKSWVNEDGARLAYTSSDAGLASVRFAQRWMQGPEVADLALRGLEGDEAAVSQLTMALGEQPWDFVVPLGRRIVKAEPRQHKLAF